MGRQMGDGRAAVLAALRPLLARLTDLLESAQANGDAPGYDTWGDADYAYLESHLPGLGIAGLDIAVAGDEVLVRVAIDRSP